MLWNRFDVVSLYFPRTSTKESIVTEPDPLAVKANENGRVRVFTTELQPEGASAITPTNVSKLLGAEVIPRKVEIVPSKVFGEMGLTQYLIDGYGIDSSELDGRRAALDALTGLVILLPSSAFGGKEVALSPDASLRLVGMFSEEPSKAHDMAQHETSSATVQPTDTRSNPPSTSRRGSSVIALGALIIAAALLLFYVVN